MNPFSGLKKVRTVLPFQFEELRPKGPSAPPKANLISLSKDLKCLLAKYCDYPSLYAYKALNKATYNAVQIVLKDYRAWVNLHTFHCPAPIPIPPREEINEKLALTIIETCRSNIRKEMSYQKTLRGEDLKPFSFMPLLFKSIIPLLMRIRSRFFREIFR